MLSGSVLNSGLIDVDTTYGIYVSSSTIAGSVTNSGTIDPGYGMYFYSSNIGVDLINSGMSTAEQN